MQAQGGSQSKKAAGRGPGHPKGSTQQGGGTSRQVLSASCFCFVEKLLWLLDLAGKEKGQGEHLERQAGEEAACFFPGDPRGC